ncbi:MAG: hypothetical protein AB2693_15095 [Candidatus Thiodiazotropha sp.]
MAIANRAKKKQRYPHSVNPLIESGFIAPVPVGTGLMVPLNRSVDLHQPVNSHPQESGSQIQSNHLKAPQD